MMSVCPCDAHGRPLPGNPAGLARIAFRHDDWRSIRRTLLEARADEVALAGWRPGGTHDLALMIAEYWATLGEVLEFYNDAIANEAFLATAVQPASVARLIAVLGYRPRPALAATATIAAIVSGRDAITLPRGFAVESIPAAAQKPQIFELGAETVVAPGGRIAMQPARGIATPDGGLLIVEGRVAGVGIGDRLRLRVPGGDRLLAVTAIGPAPDSPTRTRVNFTADSAVPAAARAAACRLERASRALPLWTFVGAAISGSDVHLAGIDRGIKAGDPVLVTAPGRAPLLATVTAVADLIWYANAGSNPAVSPGANALPVPHSRLTLATAPGSGWNAATTSVHTGWVEVGRLADQPPADWTGTPAELETIAPASLPTAAARAALIAGAGGPGFAASLTATAGATTATVAVDPVYLGSAALPAPLAVLTNLLSVSRGKTVAREVLGSGDAKMANQSFTLAKSPVTYLRNGADYRSTITILLAGEPWREVASFYGQPADAAIFTSRETEDGKTRVAFGDGVNGRRLPTGRDNVVARYRHGAGAEAPGATRLTRIVSPLPGLTKLLDPVGAGSGADAESADTIRRYAPRSVLTLGRAVAVADYEAFAAEAAAPNRVRAVWAWDEVRQRTAATIYVAGGPGELTVVRSAMAAVGDPHRPVVVAAAHEVPIRLALSLRIAAGVEADSIVTAAIAALVGDDGVFAPTRLGIGQALFRSTISAAVLAIPGIVTILAARLFVDFPFWGAIELPMPIVRPTEDGWLSLTTDRLAIGVEIDDG